METVTQEKTTHFVSVEQLPIASVAAERTPMATRWFPEKASARIYQPSRSVTSSAPRNNRGWRLAFERRTPPSIDPLMGWTGGDDTLTQLVLHFPTLERALRYAERQGLTYRVEGGPELSPGTFQAPAEPANDAVPEAVAA